MNGNHYSVGGFILGDKETAVGRFVDIGPVARNDKHSVFIIAACFSDGINKSPVSAADAFTQPVSRIKADMLTAANSFVNCFHLFKYILLNNYCTE